MFTASPAGETGTIAPQIVARMEVAQREKYLVLEVTGQTVTLLWKEHLLGKLGIRLLKYHLFVFTVTFYVLKCFVQTCFLWHHQRRRFSGLRSIPTVSACIVQDVTSSNLIQTCGEKPHTQSPRTSQNGRDRTDTGRDEFFICEITERDTRGPCYRINKVKMRTAFFSSWSIQALLPDGPHLTLGYYANQRDLKQLA